MRVHGYAHIVDGACRGRGMSIFWTWPWSVEIMNLTTLLRTQIQNWPLGEYIWYYDTTAGVKIIAKWSKKLSRAKIGSKLVRHPPDPRKWQHKDPMWQIY